MIRRLLRLALDGLLIAAIIVGALRLQSVMAERQLLRREYGELVGLVGQLEITDPRHIYWVRLESEDPLRWRYRVYLPAGIKPKWTFAETYFDDAMKKIGSGGSASGSSGTITAAEQIIIEAGILTQPDGTRIVAFTRPGGSSRMSFRPGPSFAPADPASYRIQTPDVGVQQSVTSDGSLVLLTFASATPDPQQQRADKDTYPGFTLQVDVRGLTSGPDAPQAAP